VTIPPVARSTAHPIDRSTDRGIDPRPHEAHAGETLAVPERMIVAPVVGIFRPHEVADGVEILAGDEIGVVEGPGTRCPIRSPFGGTLMGMLAHPGERLRSGQPIAWLRVA
jgi:[acyl-carrier-protein] S-malonyltransferase